MTADYHSAQGDFSSIVYNLSPMALTSFVMWLDVKVAEFKVYGQMLLDQQEDSDVTKWFLRSGITPDILPHAKQKPQFSNPRRYERSKRPISSTAPHPHVIPPSVSKQQKIDLSSDNDVVEIDSKSILPIESSMMEELTNLESEMTSYLGSSQNFKSNSQLSKSHPKQNSGTFQQKEVSSLKTDSASSRSVTDDTSHFITDSGNNLVETQTKTSSDLSITPTHSSVQLHESRTKTLESSVRSKIPYSKSNEHQSTSSPVSLQSSSHSKEINKITHSKPVDMIPAADTWASDNMDLVLKVEPADEEFDEIEKQDSHFQTISHTNHKMNMSDGNSFTPGQNVQIVSKDNAMYLDDGSGEQFTDEKVSVHVNTEITPHQRSVGFWKPHRLKFKNKSNFGESEKHLTTPQLPEVSPFSSNMGDSSQMFLHSDNTYAEDSGMFGENFQLDKKGFECEYCGYKTNLVSDLRSHIRTSHSLITENYVSCKKCGRGFKHKSSLLRHERETHLENVPAVQMYVCQHCPYRTFRASNLKRHSFKHNMFSG